MPEFDTTRAANLLAPLTFTDSEIGKFISRHACGLCLSKLVKKPAPDRKWFAVCPNCGVILPYCKVTARAAQEAESNQRAAKIEIAAASRCKRSEAEIMSELGF
jgi:hypothetical protein